ncbi:MAG: methionyl-tRNA formyltransferase [Actinomycetaceae bacterium]|nr:methionyl-tRNA formyltransferase [Actinomycetaceae bacterium]
MRILFAGTPETAVPLLEALLETEHEVVGVLTRPDARKGRSKKLSASAVAVAAQAMDLPVFKPPKLVGWKSELEQLRPDLILVVAYGQIIPESMLNLAKFGWVNVHYSLLPRWRGAAPVQRAIEAGDSETGVSIFQIEKGLDTGPVFWQESVPIKPGDTAAELFESLNATAAQALPVVLGKIADGSIVGVAQEGEVTYAKMLSVSEGQIDWETPAEAIVQKICAFSPKPGAWTQLPDGKRLKVWAASASDKQIPSGRLVVEKHRVLVGTSTLAVQLDRLSPAGKGKMRAADWARGARLEGDVQL